MAVEVLSESLRADPDDLGSRWLLNLAYMTLGRYPDGVPAQYRIDPTVFDSDESFPRFEEIAGRLGLASFDLAGGAIVEDFTGDGRLDIMSSTSDTSGQLRFYVSDGRGAFVERTTSAGLDGLEVWHPGHRSKTRKRLRKLARRWDLVATGGSDFHGAARPDVILGRGRGTIDVGQRTLDEIRARAERYA